MSDGPYKSLPMSRAWKKLAEFAQNPNFELADLGGAALEALTRDWRRNVPLALIAAAREVFCGSQSGLFPEQHAEQLRALSGLAVNQPFARLFIDCAVVNAEAGHVGEAAFAKAAADALLARGARGMRQVEEHYYRKSTAALGKTVRARLEAGITGADLDGCARALLKLTAGPARRPSLKHQGLDEGVSI